METTFFSPVDLMDYFGQGKLREEVKLKNTIGICSVSDLLHITEDHKKGVLGINNESLSERFSSLQQEESLHVAELDKDQLFSALFEKDNNVVTGLCEQSANKAISPRRSLRLLSLKVCDESIWWSERVQEEVDKYHNEFA